MRARSSPLFRLILSLGLVLVPGWSHAAALSAITVTAVGDGITVNGNCTLREAIMAANTNAAVDACPAGSGADVITLPAGTYTITIPGGFEDLNQTGDLDVWSDLTIQGAGRDKTIIKLDSTVVVDRILDLIHPERNVQISGITFRDGSITDEYSDEMEYEEPNGGAIRNRGTLTISNAAFFHNIADGGASGGGGGIYNDGTLTGKNLIFEANDSGGGGGSIHNTGVMTVTNSLIYRNLGYGSGGIFNELTGYAELLDVAFMENRIGLAGGAAIFNGGSMKITDSLFDKNAGDSGTVFNSGELIMDAVTFTRNDMGSRGTIESYQGFLEITRSAFIDNQAGQSGAIYLGTDMQATISNSIFVDNTGNQSGGAIMVDSANLVLRGTTIRGNQSYKGGGIYNDGGVVEIYESTISGNTGQAGGGAIYNNGELIIENSTISGNEGSPGGGIMQESGYATFDFVTISGNRYSGVSALAGTLDFRSSILAGNTAVINPDCSVDYNVAIESRSGNVVGIANGCAWPLDVGDMVGFNYEPVDAKLGPLADNGGPTFTHALLAGSPAIDLAGTIGCPSTDQRGVDRPLGASCDSGSYEGSAANLMQYRLFMPRIGVSR